MWPVECFRKRTYDRRYKAAIVVFLGTYMIDRLDADQRARFEAALSENFNRSDTPAVAWKRLARDDLMAAFRAGAMQRVGIEPPIAGLSWAQLFMPWAHWRRFPLWPVMPGFDILPAQLVLDFRPMDQATADAEAFLRSHGITIPHRGSLASKSTFAGGSQGNGHAT